MLGELAIRFALGGAIVTAFALLGELVQPKTFAPRHRLLTVRSVPASCGMGPR